MDQRFKMKGFENYKMKTLTGQTAWEQRPVALLVGSDGTGFFLKLELLDIAELNVI